MVANEFAGKLMPSSTPCPLLPSTSLLEFTGECQIMEFAELR